MHKIKKQLVRARFFAVPRHVDQNFRLQLLKPAYCIVNDGGSGTRLGLGLGVAYAHRSQIAWPSSQTVNWLSF